MVNRSCDIETCRNVHSCTCSIMMRGNRQEKHYTVEKEKRSLRFLFRKLIFSLTPLANTVRQDFGPRHEADSSATPNQPDTR